MKRRQRRSLLGTAARTAVIAGTATSVSGNVARRQDAAHQAAAAPPDARAAHAAPDRLGQLERLNELKKSGALTKPEFEREKAKILAS